MVAAGVQQEAWRTARLSNGLDLEAGGASVLQLPDKHVDGPSFKTAKVPVLLPVDSSATDMIGASVEPEYASSSIAAGSYGKQMIYPAGMFPGHDSLARRGVVARD